MKKVPLKLKQKFYEAIVKPAITYESEYWAFNKKKELKIKVAEIKNTKIAVYGDKV